MINKKGMTLVEVIISVTLVSIVTMFIYALFINVQDINDESKTTSSYLINKSLIIKTIEEDLNSASSLHVTKDGCNNVYSSIKYKYKRN